MIQVTRLNGTKYWINPHQIETIECNPDVTLQMLSGKYYVIKETPEEILEAIVAYRRKIGIFNSVPSSAVRPEDLFTRLQCSLQWAAPTCVFF